MNAESYLFDADYGQCAALKPKQTDARWCSSMVAHRLFHQSDGFQVKGSYGKIL